MRAIRTTAALDAADVWRKRADVTFLTGKTALVTGAARRVGREIALRLAESGADLLFNYRSSREEAEETQRDLRNLGVRALAVQADLTSLSDCDGLLRAAVEFGEPDILVNNASDFLSTPLGLLSGDRDVFEEIFSNLCRVHMQAPLYLGIQLGLKMKQRGWGRIVNITDRTVARSQAYRNHCLYLATKYGLHGVTQALAAELAPEVGVNSVAPGFVLAPSEYSSEKVERLKRKNPLQKSAGAREIANDVHFLIAAEFKTGACIVSDGGEGLG